MRYQNRGETSKAERVMAIAALFKGKLAKRAESKLA